MGDLLNNDCLAHPLNITVHSKTHLVCLAAGLRSDTLRGELAALVRPQLLATAVMLVLGLGLGLRGLALAKNSRPQSWEYIVRL